MSICLSSLILLKLTFTCQCQLFSSNEKFYASAVARPSVCRLRSCALLSPLQFSAMFLRHPLARRKPVLKLTHASIVCEGMLASVNSVKFR